jgi:hypothetical protein
LDVEGGVAEVGEREVEGWKTRRQEQWILRYIKERNRIRDSGRARATARSVSEVSLGRGERERKGRADE